MSVTDGLDRNAKTPKDTNRVRTYYYFRSFTITGYARNYMAKLLLLPPYPIMGCGGILMA